VRFSNRGNGLTGFEDLKDFGIRLMSDKLWKFDVHDRLQKINSESQKTDQLQVRLMNL